MGPGDQYGKREEQAVSAMIPQMAKGYQAIKERLEGISGLGKAIGLGESDFVADSHVIKM